MRPLFLFVFLHVSYICKAQLIFPEGGHKIPFTWMPTENDQYGAMLIPVRLKGCPQTFYMQFDTGSPYSMFYRNKLQAIEKRYKQAVQVPDTVKKLQQFSFSLDHTSILATTIAVQQFDSTGVNWDQQAIEIIGTLGTDLIDNQLITIHYPEKYILLSPDNGGETWAGFIYQGGRILLPFSLQGKDAIAYFDTGSSAFELLTDKTTAVQLSIAGTAVTSQAVESWGKTLTAVSIQTADSITIASQQLPLRLVTYMEGVSDTQVSAMKKMGIGGMLGNRLFLNHVLMIDTRNKRFSVR